jgi:hypothetical protein
VIPVTVLLLASNCAEQAPGLQALMRQGRKQAHWQGPSGFEGPCIG